MNEETRLSRTRMLLLAGIAGGPLFLASSVLQGMLRDGFSFAEHPPSALSGGDLGWLQITTFVLAGTLLAAGGFGLRLALRGLGSVWAPRLMIAFGLALVGGGLFPMDPAFGFPPGAPVGPPEVVSWRGLTHGIVFTIGFGALIVACLVFARSYGHRGSIGMRRGSLACGSACLVLAMSPSVGDPEGRFLLLWLAVTVGMGWTAVVIGDALGQAARRHRSPRRTH
jgi:hypothetical protein